LNVVDVARVFIQIGFE